MSLNRRQSARIFELIDRYKERAFDQIDPADSQEVEWLHGIWIAMISIGAQPEANHAYLAVSKIEDTKPEPPDDGF